MHRGRFTGHEDGIALFGVGRGKFMEQNKPNKEGLPGGVQLHHSMVATMISK
jgi:hypothetical protein